jgi:hypothetical protein
MLALSSMCVMVMNEIDELHESTAMTSPPVAVVVALSSSDFLANPSLSSSLVISAGRKMRLCGSPFESRDSVANSTRKGRGSGT